MPQLLLMPDPRPLVERLGPDFFRQMSEKPGVYLMRDPADQVLYVGKAKNLRKRLGSYRVANPDRLRRRHLLLLRAVARIEIEECHDELAALAREAELLLQLRPRFNRAGTWPGTPRFLAWQATSEGLALAVTLTVDFGWFAPKVPTPSPHPEPEGLVLTCSHDGGIGRKDAIPPQPAAEDSLGKGATLRATQPWGAVYGPLGAGAVPLRAALARLLWGALHPHTGLAGLPEGWVRGQHREVSLIPKMRVTQSEVEAAERRLKGLFASDWLGFAEWIRERIPGRHTFELAMRDADLELVAKALKFKV